MLCMWRGLKLIRSSRSAEFCDQCNSNTPIGGTGVGLARLGCGIGPTPELGIRINFNLALCKCNLVVRMILGFNHYTMPRSYIGPFLPGHLDQTSHLRLLLLPPGRRPIPKIIIQLYFRLKYQKLIFAFYFLLMALIF